MDEKNVGLILQSVLGGFAPDFAMVGIKDWVFKFIVFFREVGLMIYNLGIISDASFKVAFFLWNERGLHLAESFISASLGTNFHWIEVRSKKKSYADVVRSSPPLSGANRIPLGTSLPKKSFVFSRLNTDDF